MFFLTLNTNRHQTLFLKMIQNLLNLQIFVIVFCSLKQFFQLKFFLLKYFGLFDYHPKN
jgi:hypothetical protein